MGIYRRIEVAIWSDSKFGGLSPVPPSGQGLFLYLLTGPHTGVIPGLFVAGKAALAEALGWSTEDFARCITEIEVSGMIIADWSKRLVWIPNALKHNMPKAMNNIKSWAPQWKLLPQCRLRDQAALSMSEHFDGDHRSQFLRIAGIEPSAELSSQLSYQSEGQLSAELSSQLRSRNRSQEQENPPSPLLGVSVCAYPAEQPKATEPLSHNPQTTPAGGSSDHTPQLAETAKHGASGDDWNPDDPMQPLPPERLAVFRELFALMPNQQGLHPAARAFRTVPQEQWPLIRADLNRRKLRKWEGAPWHKTPQFATYLTDRRWEDPPPPDNDSSGIGPPITGRIDATELAAAQKRLDEKQRQREAKGRH